MGSVTEIDLRETYKVVYVGPPGSGKSSLI